MERGNSAEMNPHTAIVAAISEADSGERTENDRRIVVVGRTGAGKSATGNTILQMRAFQSKASGSSVTKICERQIKQILGKRIILIDTPGLFDTNLAQGELTREIIRCITMSAPGPHVFLLVLRLDRFTKEDIDTFGLLSDIFGERMSEFSVIAFTHLDNLEHDDSSIEQFIPSSDDALKNLLRKVNNRYIGFNNRALNDEKHRQSEAVLKYVEEIVEKNGGDCYTTEYYKEAEEILRRKIQEVERIKAEEKQREIEKVEKKFAGEIKAAKDFNIMLSKTIEKQKLETAKIKEEQRKNQAKLERLHFYILDQNKKTSKSIIYCKRQYDARNGLS